MRMLFAILAVLLVLTASGTALAEESTEGVIDGQVINHTEGGGSVAGLRVSLYAYAEETLGETRTTQTDTAGTFHFTGLPMDYEYLISVNYMEVDYYCAVNFGDSNNTARVEIPVCDATTSDAAIRVALAHAIIYVERESISITEVLWLVNDSDRTFVGTEETAVGGQQGTLVYTLPEGATDFEPSGEVMQEYLLLGNNRVADNLAFPPGEREAIYSYRLDRSGSDDMVISLNIHYPTDILYVMVAGEDIEVTSSQLKPAEPVEAETGEHFIRFAGEFLPRGSTIDVRLFKGARAGGAASVVPWIIGAVIVIGIFAYLWWRRTHPGVPAPAGRATGIDSRREQLLREMVQLDSDLGQGLLDENTYREMYGQKKAQLEELELPENGENSVE